ncbi:dihydrolipoyl dehydrogenase [Thermodesulfobacteriota bacterium]
MGELVQETEVLVIGSGPGGYAAAFRAADMGMDVTMVDMEARPGGECLFRGCIPSKTLLYLAELLHDTGRADAMGITFGEPQLNLDKIRSWKEEVIDKLADGLVTLCDKRGVQRLQGRARFEGPGQVRLQDSEVSHIKFRHAVLATGTSPSPLPDMEFVKGSRIMDSGGALKLPDIPESLLIFGGGYIGLEMGTVYAALGSRVTLALRSERLLRGADQDLAAPLIRRVKNIFENIHFNTSITELKEEETRVRVAFDGEVENSQQTFDRVLIAIGRKPNTEGLGIENTRVKLDGRGYVVVDEQQRTTDEKIFAIGDVVGGPLLAHKAIHEGKVAAEVIGGEPSAFEPRAIPAVVYTDPQVAWCGLTEDQAKKDKIPVKVERFSWKFSSRATTMDTPEGLTKIIIDPETKRILGFGITGREAEGMIGEGVLAVEMGALAQDLALSIHPHPTLSETLGEVADVFLGTSTHVLPTRKK